MAERSERFYGKGDKGKDGGKSAGPAEKHATERGETHVRHQKARDDLHKAHQAEMDQMAQRQSEEMAAAPAGGAQAVTPGSPSAGAVPAAGPAPGAPAPAA